MGNTAAWISPPPHRVPRILCPVSRRSMVGSSSKIPSSNSITYTQNLGFNVGVCSSRGGGHQPEGTRTKARGLLPGQGPAVCQAVLSWPRMVCICLHRWATSRPKGRQMPPAPKWFLACWMTQRILSALVLADTLKLSAVGCGPCSDLDPAYQAASLIEPSSALFEAK